MMNVGAIDCEWGIGLDNAISNNAQEGIYTQSKASLYRVDGVGPASVAREIRMAVSVNVGSRFSACDIELYERMFECFECMVDRGLAAFVVSLSDR
jgi:hypothetical protein